MDEEGAHMDLMVEELRTDKLFSLYVQPRAEEEALTPPNQILRTF